MSFTRRSLAVSLEPLPGGPMLLVDDMVLDGWVVGRLSRSR